MSTNSNHCLPLSVTLTVTFGLDATAIDVDALEVGSVDRSEGVDGEELGEGQLRREVGLVGRVHFSMGGSSNVAEKNNVARLVAVEAHVLEQEMRGHSWGLGRGVEGRSSGERHAGGRQLSCQR